jgi:hypothetical protein
MTDVPEYVSVNLASWDERAPVHAQSPDYAVEKFVSDPDFLSDVARSARYSN